MQAADRGMVTWSSVSSPRLAAACVIGLLAGCNALTGVGDLAATACDTCGGGIEGGADSGTDAMTIDRDGAPVDGPVADTSMEGPGGTLDPTFGTGGIIEADLIADPRAVAVRADGRIVVAGGFQNELAAVAFTSTGAVDTTFGGNGRVAEGMGSSSVANALAFDSMGRALLGGVSVVVGTTTSTRYAYVVRIGASQVDPTFGNNGSWRGNDGGQEVRGLVVTANGGVALGVTDNANHTFWRLTAAGAPDPAFGSNGTASVSVGDETAGLVAQPDGFVSGGSGRLASNERALGAAKVSLAGLPASGFGAAGKAAARIGTKNDEIGKAIAAQPDGKVVVVGEYDPNANVNTVRRATAAVRFTATGQLDTAYGASGIAVIDLAEPLVARETQTTPVSVAIDAKGRALFVGTIDDKSIVAGGMDRSRVWVVRLRADGSFDPLFGAQGKLFVAAPGRLEARAATLQPDGKLVVVGVSRDRGKPFVARIVTSTTL